MIAKPKSWKLGKVIEKVMASSGISRTPVVVVVVVVFFLEYQSTILTLN